MNGTLKSWNDERGFGFIEPADGSGQVFVHIKSFPQRGLRPLVDERLSFDVRIGKDGRRQATNLVRPRTAPPPRSHGAGAATLMVIPVFGVLYVAADAIWRVPGYVLGIYLAASVVCFLAYWLDKKAARAQRHRIPERTMWMLGLVGGWPGGLVAQQVFRHKTVKTSFREDFWIAVGLNVGTFLTASFARGWPSW